MRGVELLMPLTVVLLRRDPKVRGVWGAQGGQQKHARSEGCAGRGETLTFLGQGWTRD